jgi:hypothetical protein
VYLEWTVDCGTRLLLSEDLKDNGVMYGDRKTIMLELCVRDKPKKYIDLASESFIYSFYLFLRRNMAI